MTCMKYNMDKITINGLVVPTLIGVYDFERTQKTPLIFDIDMWADISAAMHSDNVEDTVDYAKVAEFVQHVADTTEYLLLEALAGEVMRQLFTQFPIARICLAITKPNILPQADRVMVTFTRERGEI